MRNTSLQRGLGRIGLRSTLTSDYNSNHCSPDRVLRRKNNGFSGGRVVFICCSPLLYNCPALLHNDRQSSIRTVSLVSPPTFKRDKHSFDHRELWALH